MTLAHKENPPGGAPAHDKLWKLASNPFSVVGEARVTDQGITFNWLGDLPPETKLGLTPGTFPKTIEAVLAMMHVDDVQTYRESVQRSLATGEAFDMTYRLADGRGGWRWIEGRAVPTDIRDGKPVEWVFVNRDFTAQRETEETLRRSLGELEASRRDLKSEQDKLWTLAANAFSLLGEAHLTANGIELQFFGDIPPEEKMGMAPGTVPNSVDKLVAMMHPDDVKSYLEKMEHSLTLGVPFAVIYRLSDGRGGWRWLQARALSVEERDGKPVRWLHDTRDVTEQKELEEALRQSLTELQQLKAKLQAENLFLREEAGLESASPEIIGRSPDLKRILEQVKLVAATSSIVLISGETGTGKELVARAIHRHSDRGKGLFVAVNCAALPGTLVESELFGHEKGAFTGAIARRIGRFEQADGGTLFLDEVGELPMETQAKMLRVLQSGEFERVGGERLLKTDVRVIAATNRDLEQAVHEGRFRNDLYHRLAIFPIHLPPLRDRREDIPLLAAYLVMQKAGRMGRKIDQIPHSIIDRLEKYDWPGNVRELENVLERAIILSPGTSLQTEGIQLGKVPQSRRRGLEAPTGGSGPDSEHETLGANERAHILRICDATAWKIKGPGGAAERLGLKPSTLYWRLKKHGIRRPEAV
jgi:transcriptional regulator with GAF, ATPase, and Fis domain